MPVLAHAPTASMPRAPACDTAWRFSATALRCSATPRIRVITVFVYLLVTTCRGAGTPPPIFEHTHIVRMQSYASVEAHEQTLRKLLKPWLPEHTTWRFVGRRNPAVRDFPTDFAVLQTSPSSGALKLLRDAPALVRSVSPQGEHSRSLRSVHRLQHSDFEDEATLSSTASTRNANDLSADESANSHDDLPKLHAFGAGELWKRGIRGKGVRVAVFDTGLNDDAPYFGSVIERTDWTEERTNADHVGHGTFVAGLIGGSHPDCPGIAPDVDILTFRVFTGGQVSYTSWFLDAFNYAMHVGIDVLNLSIGGPDFADQPFTDKVNELAAEGIVVVSAIGNDGPLWGSLNNPGDMMETVGVGGVEPHGGIAEFSSRGMTTHELGMSERSYGRVKPDLVTYGRLLLGPSHTSPMTCRRLSGTSVASPVVAGAIALLASAIPNSRRKHVVNPASVKRALLESSRPLDGSSVYEQGSGLLDIVAAAEAMQAIDAEFLRVFDRTIEHVPAAALDNTTQNPGEDLATTRSSSNETLTPGPAAVLFPAELDITTEHCTLMWPHCSQPLFYNMIPVSVNVTVLNPAGIRAVVDEIEWVSGFNGEYLAVTVTRPERFWPWAGGLGVHLAASKPTTRPLHAEGVLRVRVRTVGDSLFSVVELPIHASVDRTPPRHRRILWDMFHSLRYPPAYVPRDNLDDDKDMLDWLGDHPHTNFHTLFRHLRSAGYFIEVLDTPLTCLPQDTAERYGALLFLDSEEYFTDAEMSRVRSLVQDGGMALLVALEWHSRAIMRAVRFEDDNTRSWWTPIVGGSNIPSLNQMLATFGIAFGNVVKSGTLQTGFGSYRFQSGNTIVRFPSGGEIVSARNMREHKASKPQSDRNGGTNLVKRSAPPSPVLGLVKAGKGAVFVYGDTDCLDTVYRPRPCLDMISIGLKHLIANREAASLPKLFPESEMLKKPLQPSSEASGRVAEPYDTETMELLRPHSRTLSQVSSGAESRFVDERQYCKLSTARLQVPVPRRERPPTRRRGWLASRRAATPVGDSARYYGPLPQGRPHLLDKVFTLVIGRDTRDDSRSVYVAEGRSGGATSPSAWWISRLSRYTKELPARTILLWAGLLMLASLWFRRASKKRLKGRRFAQGRSSSSRRSYLPTSRQERRSQTRNGAWTSVSSCTSRSGF